MSDLNNHDLEKNAAQMQPEARDEHPAQEPDDNREDETQVENGIKDNAVRKRKIVTLSIAAALVCGLGIAAVSGILSPAENAPRTSKIEQTTNDSNELAAVTFTISAEGWTEGSSPFVAYVAGTTDEGEKVAFHHAFLPDGSTDAIELAEGSYEFTWIAAVNTDGSSYKVDSVKTKLETKAGKKQEVQVIFELIPADSVTQDDFDKTMSALESALRSGDETLVGEQGKQIVQIVVANSAASPALDPEKIEHAKQQADNAADETAQNGTQAATGKPAGGNASASKPAGGSSSENTSGGNAGASKPDGGNSGSAEPPAQSHKHTWVDVTEERWVSNSVWVVDQAAWDEPVWTSVWICKCGATFNSGADVDRHLKEAALSGDFNHSYTVSESITDYIHHDEVGHWEDQGHYETVVVGRKCSGCGASA